MGRRVITDQSVLVHPSKMTDAARALEAMIQPEKKRRKSRPSRKVTIEKAIAEVERRLTADDWEGMTATTMLQLWVWCHANIYDVQPSVTPADWERALMRVGAMCRNEFDSDYTLFLEYVRWAWAREERYEKHRRETGSSRPAMGIYKLFGHYVLTDYRIECARGTA